MTLHRRLILVEPVHCLGWKVGQAAAAGGVSERTAHKWLARRRTGGVAALHDWLSTPDRSPRRTPRRRRSPRSSDCGVSAAVGRVSLVALACRSSTVGAVLHRLGPGRLATLDERPDIVRYERKLGELMHIDAKKRGRVADGVGHRIIGDRAGRRRGSGWEHLHVAVDDCSRLAYTELLPAETAEACAGFLARTAWFSAHGVIPRRLMTDNAFANTNSRATKAELDQKPVDDPGDMY